MSATKKASRPPPAWGQEMTDVHHYAPCVRLAKILGSGNLRPSNAMADGELPLLWFSANQRWEPTATKARWQNGIIVLSTLDQQLQDFGCCRFSLPADDQRLMPWLAACRFAGTGYTVRRKMEAAGRKQGANPLQWFAVADAVALSDLRFSVFNGRTWSAADISETANAWEGRSNERID